MEEMIINVGENKTVIAEQKGDMIKFDINYITEVKTIYGDEVIEKDEDEFIICIKIPEQKGLIKAHKKYIITREDYDKWFVKLTDRKTKDDKEYLVLLPKSIIPKFESLNDTHPKSIGVWYKKLSNLTWKRIKIHS